MTDLINENIRYYLPMFIETADVGFNIVFANLKNPNKEEGKRLLIYLDKLLNQSLNLDKSSLKYTHIHVDGLRDEVMDLFAEFIANKFFFLGLISDKSDTSNGHILQEINKTDVVLKKPLLFPEGVKGGSRQDRLIKAKRVNLKQRKLFYEEVLKICPNASFQPVTLLNVLRKEFDLLNELFDVKPLAIPINRLANDQSYVLINFDKSRDQLDELSLPNEKILLDVIENIILVDCEEKQIHRNFNYKELSEWNENTSNFKNLVIISASDRKCGFNKLKNRVDRIHSRYHSEAQFPKYETYLISAFEVDLLMGNDNGNQLEANFFGDSYCSFWDDFRLNIGFHEELYELQSLKMMNIYSLVLTENIRELVLKDIFSSSDDARLISRETKEILMELSTESIQELRYSLLSTFEWIRQSGWKKYLISQIESETIIVLPDFIKSNKALLGEVHKALNLGNRNQINTWFDFNSNKRKEVVILDYRDPGPYPYNISTNILESDFKQSISVRAEFLSVFFKSKYEWTRFNYFKDWIRFLNHPIRESFFKWNDVYAENKAVKPIREDYTNWEAENSYEIDRDPSSIRIKFKDSSRRTFQSSELFIVKQDKGNKLKVSRLEDMLEEDLGHSILEIQLLDELQNEFNIYEKIANVQREEKELQIIRKNYGLDDSETAGRLWKILLRKKAIEGGTNQLYEEIKVFMEMKGLRLVAKNTFENSWINLASFSLLPREKKVFLRLCEYLELPKAYFRIMLRLKNVEKQSTRDSSKQMNNLLSDLINDGCFDAGAIREEILSSNKQKYLKRHDFDEIGIAEDEVVAQLNVLVELLIPYMKFTEVEKIETINL